MQLQDKSTSYRHFGQNVEKAVEGRELVPFISTVSRLALRARVSLMRYVVKYVELMKLRGIFVLNKVG